MPNIERISFVLIALTIFLFAPPVVAQLETRASIALSATPFSIAVGDFNGDGKLDIAIAPGPGSTTNVAVLLGNGDGTFQVPVTYSVGDYPVWVEAVDLNRDGKLDLVVASPGNNTVSVLLGNGDGTFQPAMPFATPQDPSFVGVGDFNNDGKLDLITINRADSTGTCNCVAVLLGKGDGAFQEPPIVTPVNIYPAAAGLGYFTSNDKLDVAVTQEFGETSQVQILLGNGDGTFRFGEVYPVGPSPNSVAVADFNGDHKLDLAIAEFEGMGIRVFLGNGDGTFVEEADNRDVSAHSVATADLNSDGKLDLVVANFAFPMEVSVLMGNGDGTFGEPAFFAQGISAWTLATGDFNGDHKPDIAVVNEGSYPRVVTLLNTGVLDFSPNIPLVFWAQVLNTQSTPQIVTLTNSGASAVSLRSATATAGFQVSNNCNGSIAAGTSCSLNVVSAPTKLGFYKGTVTLHDSASSKPQIIEVSGRGTEVGLSPGAINFGNQTVGTTSPPQPLSITNYSNSAITVSGIALEGADKQNFTLSNLGNCTSQQLAAGATCQISVTFTPHQKLAYTATIKITDNGGGSPETATVAGTGN